ncbi:ABC transporter permease [Lamprobacter modestohalophilus]|uniref:ABC transporter permease n=1 Tax=Lamprobacter modestohalophilus TaxID=1064514 RepID=UPI002ADECA2F|nr:ABC transporter permease [Lamprobacter modestohalophilus]MEA1048959.1 ABC transporter permease [Lamprobacter modestohalophilus]
MRAPDFATYVLTAVRAQRGRSLLTITGIAIGVATVVLLTAIGEGIHRFVLAEFSQFGTNLIAVTPGKTSTLGLSGAMLSTVRPLSLADADALEQVPDVEAVVAVVQGNAAVEADGRSRRTMVFGAGPKVPEIWAMRPAIGRFLPEDSGGGRPFAVLGATLSEALFGNRSPLGARIRVGGEPFRVIGVMARKGQMLGFDLDDTVFIPVQRALAMFDRDGLMEIDLLYDRAADSSAVAERVRELLIRRHQHEDFSITTQDQMLEVLGSVLKVLTLVVGALGAISLAVGGIGILAIMTIAVHERRAEIGLLRALGASRDQIMGLFLLEALLLALLGGLAGLIIGAGGAWLIGLLVPALPTHTTWDFVLMAEVTAASIGLLAGVLPALRAAALDPVAALHDE